MQHAKDSQNEAPASFFLRRLWVFEGASGTGAVEEEEERKRIEAEIAEKAEKEA